MSSEQSTPLPPRFSRPSYAHVAGGVTTSSQHFNTLAAASTHSSTTPSLAHYHMPRQEPRAPRPRSRSPLRTADMERQYGSGEIRVGGDGAAGIMKRPGSSWSNDFPGRSDGNMGCSIHTHHGPYLEPSYLADSSHIAKQKLRYERHISELRETQKLNPPSRKPSISTSSSNANLAKLHAQHIHRAPVQDVIERLPPEPSEDTLRLLPMRWSEEDHAPGLEVLGDGNEVRFTGLCKTTDEAASVRSDYPIPQEVGLYYFEVTILSRARDGLIGIGFSGPKVNLNRLPGWEADSWAYHGDDGFSFACTASGKPYGPRYSSQNIIGCGINFRTGQAFFTRDGEYLGVAFKDIKADKLFPSVGVKRPQEHVRVNFGRSRFIFDIDKMMRDERALVRKSLETADLHSLQASGDEKAVIHDLISQYLAHQGYVETSKAFSEDVHDQEQSLSSASQQTQRLDTDDDIHALNRQKIRRAILDGDIDLALKYMSSFYPQVLQEERNQDIDFRLKCRKFIEMNRRCYELAAATSSPTTVTKSVASLNSNGHITDLDDDESDPPDTQMELDDQLHREASRGLEAPMDDVDMDGSQELDPPKATYMKHQDLMNQVYIYGAELRSAYIGDSRPEIRKQLEEAFALLAYPDPTDSVVGHLLEAGGRAVIAEEVNGAILVSLGKPAFAALEKLCTTTGALLEAAASKGQGAAAFVNVTRDFLQP